VAWREKAQPELGQQYSCDRYCFALVCMPNGCIVSAKIFCREVLGVVVRNADLFED
jgi:hypothetical protein